MPHEIVSHAASPRWLRRRRSVRCREKTWPAGFAGFTRVSGQQAGLAVCCAPARRYARLFRRAETVSAIGAAQRCTRLTAARTPVCE